MSDIAFPDGLHPEQPSISDSLKSMATFQQQSVAVMTQIKDLLLMNARIEKEKTRREEQYKKQQQGSDNQYLKSLQESRKDVNKRLDALERYLKKLPLDLVKQLKPEEYTAALQKIAVVDKKETKAVATEKNKEIGESLAWALGEQSPLMKGLLTKIAGSGGRGSDFAQRSLTFESRYADRVKGASAPFEQERTDIWDSLKFSANYGAEPAGRLMKLKNQLKTELEEKDVAISDIEFRSMFPEVFSKQTNTVGRPRDAKGRFLSAATATENAITNKRVPLKPTLADVANAAADPTPYALGVGFLYLGNLLSEALGGESGKKELEGLDMSNLSALTPSLAPFIKSLVPLILPALGITAGVAAFVALNKWLMDTLKPAQEETTQAYITTEGLTREQAELRRIEADVYGGMTGGGITPSAGDIYTSAEYSKKWDRLKGLAASGRDKTAENIVREVTAAINSSKSGFWMDAPGALADLDKKKPFYNINKYHNGGKVPYDSYEVPAILRAGERVLTPGMSDLYDQDMKDIMRVSEKLERLDLTMTESLLAKLIAVIQESVVSELQSSVSVLEKLQDGLQPTRVETPQPTPVYLGALG